MWFDDYYAHRRAFAAFVAPLVALACGACGPDTKIVDKASPEYRNVVSAFYVGLGALEVGDDVNAERKLAEVTRLAPGEPAGWGNWGVLALRQRNFDAATQRFEKTRELAPNDAHIYNLLGNLESSRGRSGEAIAQFRKAVERNPKDLRSSYALAQEIERQGGEGSEAEAQKVIESIVAAQPDNLAALLDLSRIAAKRGDAATVKSTVAKIATRASAWPPEVQEQFDVLRAAAGGADPRSAAARTTMLRNVLWRVPEFRRDYALLKAPAGEEVTPYARFLKIETPVFKPAAVDASLTFDAVPISIAGPGRWNWIGAIQLGGDGAPVIATANAEEVRLANGATLPFPGGSSRTAPSPDAILQIDYNSDFKTDLALAGAGGVRLFRQDSPTVFVDATAETKLPQAVIGGSYNGAWALDVEGDGDLDILLGTSEGAPVVLRNNGDGTFAPIAPFAGISGVRAFAWADVSGDGNPDAAIVDGAGRLHVFMNARQGQFSERPLPDVVGTVKAVAAGDVSNDGRLDLLAVRDDGAIVRISDEDAGRPWNVKEIVKISNAADVLAGEVRLRIGDFDNNGAVDFLVAPVSAAGKSTGGALVWLGNEKGEFAPLERAAGPALVFAAADTNGDGRLDLLGLGADGQATQATNRGAKNYHWQVVRPRAAQAVGDQRINSFGVGGEIEIRSGLLTQMQPIAGPQVHFGLGEQTSTDVVRVIWPNGAVRAEFEVKADQAIEAEQRLKGSCPFLFAFNGKQMEFVKDAVPWGSAIGLRINTLGSAKVAATQEWYKIGRDQLVPRDGYYDLRFTAELWEVYYYDHLALMTVDHPAGTEIFVDERFVIPPAKLAVTAVATPRAVARAVDDMGQDVTAIVSTLDGKAVDSFGHGQYQGVTRDHYLEIDLGPDAPQSGPLYLIAHGSLYPTDSSINVALSQGERWRAQPLSLEVPDGRGGFRVAQDNLGFPAGRKKTILVDLTKAFAADTPRRVRLRTNLEIYWDKIEWAVGLPDTKLETRMLDPTMADLHFRGYSVIDRENTGAPEVPDYNRIAGTKQRWADLAGYYTRFGDVRELLKQIDDRYVIVNSGDEMSLRFAEQPPPPAGWVRDFVIVGDGWIKDGDYNSTFSDTVQPLPHHAEDNYVTRPGRLEDEPAYKQHPEDWQTYHTRYVTPDVFRHALRANASVSSWQ